jgi:ATP-dependent DNA ligase
VAFQRKKPVAIGVKAPCPRFVEPALATSIEKVPSGERWIHEIKFDGYRVQAHLVHEAVKIFTRRGNDWTKRFRKTADDAWHIAAGAAIIDGEVYRGQRHIEIKVPEPSYVLTKPLVSLSLSISESASFCPTRTPTVVLRRP